MQGFFKNPVVAFFTSLKLSAVLMTVFAVAIGYATFFESAWGRDGAYAVIYGARWFEILLALLTLNMALLFVKRMPYEMRQSGYVLVHLSIVVILVGAGITRYFGYEGIMPIREGESTDYVYSDKSHVQARLGDELASFPVRPYKMGMRPIFKTVTLGGIQYKLGITEYWPFYEETMTEGPGGPAAFAYTVRESGGLAEKTLVQGDRGNLAGVDARFLDGDFSGEMVASRLGEVRIHFDGNHCDFPVTWPADGAHQCHGWSFSVTEFQTDFKVGGASTTDGPMRNPMIRLAITAPDGRKGERILFALHPDFSMGHSGEDEAFADLDLIYQVSSGIEFAPGGTTGVRARASFALETMDMNTNEQGEVAAGTVFDLQAGVVYANGEGSFSFVPVEVWHSVVSAPGLSSDSNAPAAARLVIRDSQGNEAAAICVKHRNPVAVTLGGERFRLEFGAVRIPLPYTVHLDDFVLQTYPGSDNPATYESYVSLSDPELGIEDRKVHVYMNHPMNHRGSKHFQSSYDPDRKGTVLSVNHDPGKWPTYVGYMMISVGFVLILAKDLLWPRRKRTAGDTSSPASVALALAVLGSVLLAGGALAQDDEHAGHNHAPGEGHGAPAAGYVSLSEPAREAASRLTVQDYRGRMKPLDTLAREMVMKVAKKTKYEGRHPVDQYLSWSLNPQFWWDKPLISVKFDGIKDLLGVDKSTTHVSLSSLVDAQTGRYKLSEAVDAAHRTPDRDRTKLQRKLISFDERANVLNNAFRGGSLRLYPLPGRPQPHLAGHPVGDPEAERGPVRPLQQGLHRPGRRHPHGEQPGDPGRDHRDGGPAAGVRRRGAAVGRPHERRAAVQPGPHLLLGHGAVPGRVHHPDDRLRGEPVPEQGRAPQLPQPVLQPGRAPVHRRLRHADLRLRAALDRLGPGAHLQRARVAAVHQPRRGPGRTGVRAGLAPGRARGPGRPADGDRAGRVHALDLRPDDHAPGAGAGQLLAEHPRDHHHLQLRVPGAVGADRGPDPDPVPDQGPRPRQRARRHPHPGQPQLPRDGHGPGPADRSAPCWAASGPTSPGAATGAGTPRRPGRW